MSITRIEIENYKSVEHCALSLRDVNLLIGENGTGKSNILDALCYFYASLLNDTDDRDTYNYGNRYCNEFYISVTFDFTHLRKISVRNKGRDADSNYLGYYEWISRRGQQETLRLHKVKGHVIQWNRDRKYRQNILNLFPMYHVVSSQVKCTLLRQQMHTFSRPVFSL